MGDNYEDILNLCAANAMAMLNQHSTEELSEMLGDDAKLDRLIKESPQYKAMTTEREMLLAQNKSLAEYNLSLQPKLTEAKQTLQDTYERAKTAQEEALRKKSQLEALADNRSLDTTQVLLETAAREAEEESEALAEAFISGELDMDNFLGQFKEKRSLAHMRKIKSDQMKEILRNQQFTASGANQSPSAYPPPRRPAPPAPQAYPWNYTM